MYVCVNNVSLIADRPACVQHVLQKAAFFLSKYTKNTHFREGMRV